MEMGRERPQSKPAIFAPRAADRVCSRPTVCAHPVRKNVSRSVSGSALDSLHHFPGGSGSRIPDVPCVAYAVHLMVVLRWTQSLRVRLKQFDDAPDVRSTTKLGDWYGNVIRMGNRHALLFISERSRLPIMIPVREANRLRSSFPEAVCQMLAAIEVRAEVIERERQHMSQIAFSRTRSRSLLGSLNDFLLMARMRFVTRRTDPLERIARDLAERPLILPFDGGHPSEVTRRLLSVE